MASKMNRKNNNRVKDKRRLRSSQDSYKDKSYQYSSDDSYPEESIDRVITLSQTHDSEDS